MRKLRWALSLDLLLRLVQRLEHLDGHVRAHDETLPAAGTLLRVVLARGMVAGGVELPGVLQSADGTEMHAKPTGLAAFGVYLQDEHAVPQKPSVEGRFMIHHDSGGCKERTTTREGPSLPCVELTRRNTGSYRRRS